MAFRIFRIAVGAVLGFLALWLVVSAIGEIRQIVLESGLANASLLIMPALEIVGALLIGGAFYYGMISDSRIRQVLENIFSIPELLKKLAFTVALLCIYRVGYHVPLPGLNQSVITRSAEDPTQQGGLGQAIAAFGMFTGGNLAQSTLFGLGIMPYISAAIIFQLLATVLPALQKLQKEGPAGYKKIQEYTRYATVFLCIVQAAFWMNVMRSRPEWIYDSGVAADHPSLIYFVGIIGLTTGTMFMMWLGEQIDEYGIGNGISLIIMGGIVARLPWAIGRVADGVHTYMVQGSGMGISPMEVIVLAMGFVFVVAGAILITQGQRRIPIQQAKHTRGRRVYGGQRQYLPLRVNHGGVMPIIFASSLMIFPGVILGWLQQRWPGSWINALHGAFQSGAFTYSVVEVALIFFFAYFWTTVQFRPKEMAEQLRDYGSFIPGLRPGKRTADYLEKVMERITYCGAAFLATIAVIPQVVHSQLPNVDYQVSQFLGGTGLLIVVSVALDLVQRIESNLVMRNYGGFLGGSTRIKGAYT
jgi:preprotein translocase subunit SecY